MARTVTAILAALALMVSLTGCVSLVGEPRFETVQLNDLAKPERAKAADYEIVRGDSFSERDQWWVEERMHDVFKRSGALTLTTDSESERELLLLMRLDLGKAGPVNWGALTLHACSLGLFPYSASIEFTLTVKVEKEGEHLGHFSYTTDMVMTVGFMSAFNRLRPDYPDEALDEILMRLLYDMQQDGIL
ncbi:MAG: hypothetical protein ACYTG5_18840 [Planctomycetota bacterium]|jgi:hypothetical protein